MRGEGTAPGRTVAIYPVRREKFLSCGRGRKFYRRGGIDSLRLQRIAGGRYRASCVSELRESRKDHNPSKRDGDRRRGVQRLSESSICDLLRKIRLLTHFSGCIQRLCESFRHCATVRREDYRGIRIPRLYESRKYYHPRKGHIYRMVGIFRVRSSSDGDLCRGICVLRHR